MLALFHASVTHAWCEDYTAANAQADEVANLQDQKGATYWKVYGSASRGCLFAPNRQILEGNQIYQLRGYGMEIHGTNNNWRGPTESEADMMTLCAVLSTQ